MRVSRVHTPCALNEGMQLVLDDDTAHYLSKVLRLRPQDRVSLFNALDGEFEGVIQQVGKRSVTVQLEDQVPCLANPTLAIHLGLGLSRGERMDYAIQKATEAGVSSITPLMTERCEVRLNEERKESRVTHWEKVAISACEQGGRTQIPLIHSPQILSDWLALPRPGRAFVLDFSGQSGLPREKAPEAVTFFIGPEGGLSTDEVKAAMAAGFECLRLGPRVLRTETAPVVAIALAQQLWGDY